MSQCRKFKPEANYLSTTTTILKTQKSKRLLFLLCWFSEMADEPFLSPQSKPEFRHILDDSHHGFYLTIPQSISTPALLQSEIEDHPQIQPPPRFDYPVPSTGSKKPGSLKRCKTAPAMAVMRDLKPRKHPKCLNLNLSPAPLSVGYGDRAFKTLPGRLFAGVWLLISTLAVAKAFLYLAEARVNKRHRRIAKWVLHRDITIEDLLAADINNNGFISKSEYVIYKLKEMGKVREKDILQICNQFSKLDTNNSGKITLPDLLKYQM
ncbi:hypothetical protein ES332_D11G118300v1 [Gossypium tomentosum]|uniref:EF-hand domain-containing protein n=1 Tax=Gossypium tomentosum TaxID=34277 RepID=A0A5D2IM74_GOSTO|nr:hypothetical protein ES332_D11G118300v1 [Gossypium tomentosum]